MTHQAPPEDAKAAARRRRRAADTAAWRSRECRGVQLFKIEAGAYEYDLAIKYAELKESQLGNKTAVAAALGRLLRKALRSGYLRELLVRGIEFKTDE
jgi:hypothetical protein